MRKTWCLRRGLWERLRGRVKDVDAVDAVTIPIEQGSILGLVGESGCGKSTFARMMVGLIPPTGGDIQWRGTAVATSRWFRCSAPIVDVGRAKGQVAFIAFIDAMRENSPVIVTLPGSKLGVAATSSVLTRVRYDPGHRGEN